jgi:hypothetical protein
VGNQTTPAEWRTWSFVPLPVRVHRQRTRSSSRASRHCGRCGARTQWRDAAHRDGVAGILRRRADPGQVTGSGIASPRCCPGAGGAPRCRKSVGTAADALPLAGPAGRTGTKGLDVSAGHGRVGTKRLDLDETPVSYGTEGKGFEPFGDQSCPPVTWQDASKPGRECSPRSRLKRGGGLELGTTSHAPRCPPATTPGRPGGQLATHATHTPVTDGAGHAFAMRRSGVRVPSAPQIDTLALSIRTRGDRHWHATWG